MPGVRIDVTDGVAKLDCRSFQLGDQVLGEQLATVQPLIGYLLTAMQARSQLSDDVLLIRLQDILVQEMVCAAHLQLAIGQAERLIDVVDGELTVAELGFPEFRSEQAVDV